MSVRRNGGMADAYGSGPYGSNTVWVQVPSSAPGKARFFGLFSFLCIRTVSTVEILDLKYVFLMYFRYII